MIDKPARAGEYIPPAFPNFRWEGWGTPEEGMTLRDYFAAKAMQGLLASNIKDRIDEFAKQAYIVADAMMKAREA